MSNGRLELLSAIAAALSDGTLPKSNSEEVKSTINILNALIVLYENKSFRKFYYFVNERMKVIKSLDTHLIGCEYEFKDFLPQFINSNYVQFEKKRNDLVLGIQKTYKNTNDENFVNGLLPMEYQRTPFNICDCLGGRNCEVCKFFKTTSIKGVLNCYKYGIKVDTLFHIFPDTISNLRTIDRVCLQSVIDHLFMQFIPG